MDKPTDAQMKEFWEWYGWKVEMCHHKYCAYEDKNHSHIYPPDKVGKQGIDYGAVNGYPKIDLNNLFKYAVPKLDICTRIEFHMNPVKGEREWVAVIQVPQWRGQELDYKSVSWCDQDPALALFWALDKVRKEEKSNE